MKTRYLSLLILLLIGATTGATTIVVTPILSCSSVTNICTVSYSATSLSSYQNFNQSSTISLLSETFNALNNTAIGLVSTTDIVIVGPTLTFQPTANKVVVNGQLPFLNTVGDSLTSNSFTLPVYNINPPASVHLPYTLNSAFITQTNTLTLLPNVSISLKINPVPIPNINIANTVNLTPTLNGTTNTYTLFNGITNVTGIVNFTVKVGPIPKMNKNIVPNFNSVYYNASYNLTVSLPALTPNIITPSLLTAYYNTRINNSCIQNVSIVTNGTTNHICMRTSSQPNISILDFCSGYQLLTNSFDSGLGQCFLNAQSSDNTSARTWKATACGYQSQWQTCSNTLQIYKDANQNGGVYQTFVQEVVLVGMIAGIVLLGGWMWLKGSLRAPRIASAKISKKGENAEEAKEFGA